MRSVYPDMFLYLAVEAPGPDFIDRFDGNANDNALAHLDDLDADYNLQRFHGFSYLLLLVPNASTDCSGYLYIIREISEVGV